MSSARIALPRLPRRRASDQARSTAQRRSTTAPRSRLISRRGPRILLLLLLIAAVVGGGYLWVRDSSLVAVFQPHLYSRTAALYREFGEALALADTVVVVDVYRAREDPAEYPGVSGLLIASAAADAGQGRQVAWMPGFEQAERFLRATLREGDLMLALGAGNIDDLARLLVVAPDPDDVAARAG